MKTHSMPAFATILLTILLIALPAKILAQPGSAMPLAAADSAFYLQINIDRMRTGAASAQLYQWLEREALNELREELGNDMIDQLDGISIFGSGAQQHPAIVLHGATSQQLRDRIVDKFFADNDEVELLSKHQRNYYAFGDIDIKLDGLTINEIDSDMLFLAFGDNNQTLITPAEDVLDDFLQQGSFVIQAMPQDLIIIQADRTLAQGGMNPNTRCLVTRVPGNHHCFAMWKNSPWWWPMPRTASTSAWKRTAPTALLPLRWPTSPRAYSH